MKPDGVSERTSRIKALLAPATVTSALALGQPRPDCASLFIRCPFHAENTPSFQIKWTQTGTRFRCWGACQSRGDVLDLIARMKGWRTSGPDFLRVLAFAEAAITLAAPASGGSVAPQTLSVDAHVRSQVLEVLLEMMPLANAPDADAYLSARGIRNEAVEDGWSALPAGNVSGLIHAFVEQVGTRNAEAVGLLTRSGNVWSPHHRLFIPWRAPDGSVHNIQRRAIGGALGTAQKYKNAPQSQFLHPYGIDSAARVARSDTALVFAEGAIDVLSLRRLYRAHGFNRLPLGLPSASAWRPEWATLGAGRTVYLGLDGDAAGDASIGRIAADLRAAGATLVERIKPRDASDWNDQLGIQQ